MRKNREILFLIEKNSLKQHSENMARILMNKFSISEQDQHEISGIHSYFNQNSDKSKSSNIQRIINDELLSPKYRVSNVAVTLDIFICGSNFIGGLNVSKFVFQLSKIILPY